MASQQVKWQTASYSRTFRSLNNSLWQPEVYLDANEFTLKLNLSLLNICQVRQGQLELCAASEEARLHQHFSGSECIHLNMHQASGSLHFILFW